MTHLSTLWSNCLRFCIFDPPDFSVLLSTLLVKFFFQIFTRLTVLLLSVVRLSCLKVEDMWFALMGTKGKVGTMLSVISIFAILLYFVTSADSG